MDEIDAERRARTWHILPLYMHRDSDLACPMLSTRYYTGRLPYPRQFQYMHMNLPEKSVSYHQPPLPR